MRQKFVGQGPEKEVAVFKNAEATATMPLGCPLILNLSGTVSTDVKNDGRDCVLPATAAAINYQLWLGVNVSAQNPLPVQAFGEALIYGYCPYTLVKLRTRATSTDTWASVATVASGNLLVPDFTYNVWQTLANVAAQSTPGILQLDTIASLASGNSIAGGAGDTRTVSTALIRSFVRMM